MLDSRFLGFCVFAVQGFAVGFGASVSDLEYEDNGDGITITRCDSQASGVLDLENVLIEGKPITQVGVGAFGVCTELTEIKLPDSVVSIGAAAFRQCFGLTSLDLPAGVTTLESNLFNGCSALTTVNLPDGLVTVSITAFDNAFGLTEINASASSENFATIDGVCYSKDLTTIVRYPQAKTEAGFSVPAGVTAIGDRAFYQVNQLGEVILPMGLVSVGDDAFQDMDALTIMTFPASLNSIGSHAFQASGMLSQVVFEGPAPVDVGQNAFNQVAAGAEALVLPSQVDDFGGEGEIWNGLVVTVVDTPAGVEIVRMTYGEAKVTIEIKGEPSTNFYCYSSTILTSMSFVQEATTPALVTTDANGAAIFEVPIGSELKKFYVVDSVPAS